MAVVVNKKYVMVAAIIILSACGGAKDAVFLSRHYGVCAHLPAKASFQSRPGGQDFGLGSISMNGSTVDVFIGGHPDFSRDAVWKGVDAIDGFEFVGEERSDGQGKLLFAYNRGERRGPMYVMFSSPDLTGVKSELLAHGFLFSCDVPNDES